MSMIDSSDYRFKALDSFVAPRPGACGDDDDDVGPPDLAPAASLALISSSSRFRGARITGNHPGSPLIAAGAAALLQGFIISDDSEPMPEIIYVKAKDPKYCNSRATFLQPSKKRVAKYVLLFAPSKQKRWRSLQCFQFLIRVETRAGWNKHMCHLLYVTKFFVILCPIVWYIGHVLIKRPQEIQGDLQLRTSLEAGAAQTETNKLAEPCSVASKEKQQEVLSSRQNGGSSLHKSIMAVKQLERNGHSTRDSWWEFG
ncbi:hypothetical protein SELMODRAFT_448493 [Selaginella moellendorffii]|uniref:Uncharacterized protein n=1 Tax=Selaginella moellendorffii TaxID=88036 RepID=D8T7Q2_SELML|nr:hypothetical protein SELMODRAFT_448493 [Selaginella moellendorffii]